MQLTTLPSAKANMIVVSPDLTVMIGPGRASCSGFPTRASLLAFVPGDDGLVLRIVARPGQADLTELLRDGRCVVLAVGAAAFERYFDWSPQNDATECYHLPQALRAIAIALTEQRREGPAILPWRAAKATELLCETMVALGAGSLVPHAGEGQLNERDARAIVAARRLIDVHWTEKLTLDSIARSCGINRAKLTRGFRELYRCTVGEALAERRLAEAQSKLLTTDLPVSTIGYASGYLNNASFTRAFGRRFGVSPSDFRATRKAAA